MVSHHEFLLIMSSTTISDLYKGLNVITELLKDISNAVKDDPAINQKLNEATETFAKISSNVTESSPLAPIRKVHSNTSLTDIQANVEGENANTTTTEEPPSHTEWETEEPRLEILIGHAMRHPLKKAWYPSKAIKGAKAGEMFKKAQDAEHVVLKKQHTEKVRKSLELRKHKYDSYMWTVSNRLKQEPIVDIKFHPKTKPVVITVYRGTDDRNFDVHKPFLFGAFGISELDDLREIIPKKKNYSGKRLD
ncbi:hypothetical protein Tco_1533019 [Tanacetum coccineum]